MLRDISFSGAKIIIMGVAKFLVDKETAVRLDFDDPRESFLVKGKFVRAENVEGRKELVALAVDFKENEVPMGYKVRLNDYLSVVRADNRDQSDTPAAKAQAAAQAADSKSSAQSSAQGAALAGPPKPAGAAAQAHPATPSAK
jgi:hypothetical protein